MVKMVLAARYRPLTLLIGTVAIIAFISKYRDSLNSQIQGREKREEHSHLKRTFKAEDSDYSEYESSADWYDDYYNEGSGSNSDGVWIQLLKELDGDGSPVTLKKAGDSGDKKSRKSERKTARKAARENKGNRRANRKGNRPENYLNLSKKNLARADQRLKEMAADQATEWVKLDARSWEFNKYITQETAKEIGKLPDEFAGHEGHDDIAPAVHSLLEAGRCQDWKGSERPLNFYFAVQNNVPLHASNKKTDFNFIMSFITESMSQVSMTNKNKFKVFEWNELDTISDANFDLSSSSSKKMNMNRLSKKIKRSVKVRPTLSRPKIKPIVEKLNSVLDADKTTLMSGSTNIVVIVITNIPDDLAEVDEEYLHNEVEKLNRLAFVVVVFVHPKSDGDLRSIPYRMLPKSWGYGLRDNEFSQRILVKDFHDLEKNKGLQNTFKNMLCLVDERLQCRLSHKPWSTGSGSPSLQMRSNPSVDSCCGHEIAAKAYDSRLKTCCRDGSVKSWMNGGSNPCGNHNL